MDKLYWRYRFWRAANNASAVYTKYTLPVLLLILAVYALLPLATSVKVLLYLLVMVWFNKFCRHERNVAAHDRDEHQAIRAAEWVWEAKDRRDFIDGSGRWEGDQ